MKNAYTRPITFYRIIVFFIIAVMTMINIGMIQTANAVNIPKPNVKTYTDKYPCNFKKTRTGYYYKHRNIAVLKIINYSKSYNYRINDKMYYATAPKKYVDLHKYSRTKQCVAIRAKSKSGLWSSLARRNYNYITKESGWIKCSFLEYISKINKKINYDKCAKFILRYGNY